MDITSYRANRPDIARLSYRNSFQGGGVCSCSKMCVCTMKVERKHEERQQRRGGELKNQGDGKEIGRKGTRERERQGEVGKRAIVGTLLMTPTLTYTEP